MAPAVPPKVYLVGAGPGRADYLTVRAAQVIGAAQCVIHDQLVSADILAMVPKTAEVIYAGKKKANYAMRQQEIQALMIDRGLSGKITVRLKGGDPFIFGRGGEEVTALKEAGLDFEVVPGISAAVGIAAMHGLPLTHRDHASTLIWTTGHNLNTGSTPDLPWDLFVRPKTCLVIYMALSSLPEVCERMLKAGAQPNLPVLAVSSGTLPNERLVRAPLHKIAAEVAAAGLQSPTLFYFGGAISAYL